MIHAIRSGSLGIDDKLLKLKRACRGFEAIMVEEMLKEMDKTLPGDGFIKNNAANDIYRSMYIDALARKISESSPFGIGKLLFDSLKKYVEYKKATTSKGNSVELKPMRIQLEPAKMQKIDPQKRKLIDEAVRKASEKYSVPEKLIYGIIKMESDFNPDLVSSKGAVGLMQLMPGTALEMGVRHIYDIEENIMGGVKYLSQLINRFKNWKLAIAAYNAGPSAVEKYKGVPPYKETRNYVRKVLAYIDGRY